MRDRGEIEQRWRREEVEDIWREVEMERLRRERVESEERW
jgi:hypothetical protein